MTPQKITFNLKPCQGQSPQQESEDALRTIIEGAYTGTIIEILKLLTPSYVKIGF